MRIAKAGGWIAALILSVGCSGDDASPGETDSSGSSGGSSSSASSSTTAGTTTAGTGSTSTASTTATTTTATTTTGDETSGGTTGQEGRDYGPERDEFFGDSRCDTAGLVLCDGFENAGIDENLWEISASGNNTVEIVADQSARGGQSVHIQTNDGFGRLRNMTSFPIAGNRYWGRMFIRVDRFSTVDWAHWTMAEAAGQGDGSLIRVGGQYNSNQMVNRWGVGSDGGATGDWTTHDQDPDGNPIEPPEDEWICLEWLHDGDTDEGQFFVDAVEHPSLATTSDVHGGNDVPYDLPMFESVWFGWWQYQSDPQPFDVWIDEVAIDTERIGCKL
jgi:hypothetical protein